MGETLEERVKELGHAIRHRRGTASQSVQIFYAVCLALGFRARLVVNIEPIRLSLSRSEKKENPKDIMFIEVLWESAGKWVSVSPVHGFSDRSRALEPKSVSEAFCYLLAFENYGNV